MIKFIKILIVLFIVNQVNAQELNATVTINSDKISGSNKQVFKTLERSLTEFINQKKWTNKKFKTQELINCAFVLTITEQSSSTDFKGNIQIQSSRPVYNSVYQTPVFNYKDIDFAFKYTEFENLEYNPNSFDSNLVSVMVFYVYTILGMDADTFAKNGGTNYFEQAENVVNQAQQGGFEGWEMQALGSSRYKLITDILSGTYDEYRNAMYTYHIKGLDLFSEDKTLAKTNISTAIGYLKSLASSRTNSLLVRVFTDAKADEIVDIFSGGPHFDINKLKEDLNKMSPINSSKWNKIK